MMASLGKLKRSEKSTRRKTHKTGNMKNRKWRRTRVFYLLRSRILSFGKELKQICLDKFLKPSTQLPSLILDLHRPPKGLPHRRTSRRVNGNVGEKKHQ